MQPQIPGQQQLHQMEPNSVAPPTSSPSVDVHETEDCAAKDNTERDTTYSTRSWASEAQWTYLSSKLSGYREAAKNKKHHQFYQEVVDDWQKHGWTYDQCGNKKAPELIPGEEHQHAKQLRKKAYNVSPYPLSAKNDAHRLRGNKDLVQESC